MGSVTTELAEKARGRRLGGEWGCVTVPAAHFFPRTTP